MLSRASRNVAAGIFIVGLLLVGFGLLIFLLPVLFATLAAIVFFVTGAGCALTAAKIFWSQRQIDKLNQYNQGDYRENVNIHIKDEDNW